MASNKPLALGMTLKDFLKSKGFKPGSLDPTLFTKTYDGELFVCQIYVDDIIFDCTNQKYSDEFAHMMRERYQMSMMGELKYSLVFKYGSNAMASSYLKRNTSKIV